MANSRPTRLLRRQRPLHPWVLASLLIAGISLGACGNEGGSPASAPTAAPPATTAGAAAAFPVTIEHKYGSTQITRAPQRVVTVGFNDQDFALALGVTPVAVRDWFGKQPFATWPWAQDELGDAQPQVLPSGELTLLSLPFALEQLVPQLAAAVDGNPATEPTPGS